LLGISKPRRFHRSGHCAPLSFNAFGGEIRATGCAGGRLLTLIKSQCFAEADIARFQIVVAFGLFGYFR